MDLRPVRVEDLELIPDDNGYVVHAAGGDQVHHLNAAASLIIELCTGEHTVDEICLLVQDAFGLAEPPRAAVNEVLEEFARAGLISRAAHPPPS